MSDTMTDSFNTLIANEIQSNTTEQTTVETTTTETTPTVEPVTTEVTPAATETTPAFNQGEWLKTEFGVEDINTVKERYNGYETLQKDFEQLKATPPTVQPYKNELSKFIDNLPSGVDPKFAVQYYDVKPETLSDEQAWKLNEKFQKPFLSDEEINAKFTSKFGFEEESLATDNEKVLKSAMLKEESFNAKKALGDFIGKTLNPVSPEVAKQEQEAKVQAISKSWREKIPNVSSNLKELVKQVPVKMFGSDEAKMVDFKYQLPESEQKAIVEETYNTVVSIGLEPTEQNMKLANEYAVERMWAKSGEKIAYAMVSEAVSKLTENFKQIIHNPNISKTEVQNTQDQRFSAHEKSVLDMMAKGR